MCLLFSTVFFLHSFPFGSGAVWGERVQTAPDLQAFPVCVLESVLEMLEFMLEKLEKLEKATRGLQAGPAQPDAHPRVFACPWSCLVPHKPRG